MDTAHWIMQTQSMFSRSAWRVRHVDYDNAPHGRDVHWAMPFHAWLAALAWIDHTVSGRPMGIAVERATLSSGPVMLGLLLIGLIPFLSRRFSNAAAAVIGVGTITVLPFYLDFMPARADHHAQVAHAVAQPPLQQRLQVLAGSLDRLHDRWLGHWRLSPRGRG